MFGGAPNTFTAMLELIVEKVANLFRVETARDMSDGVVELAIGLSITDH